ncbi:MAG: thioredoxin family protein [Rhodomicrobium sp.]|nr:thioredoxin family protein [Rhodomicrobium sp.]
MARKIGVAAVVMVMTTLVLLLWLNSDQRPSFITASTTASKVHPYDASAFQKALDRGKTLVVHIHADWCPACRQQTPVIDALSRERSLSGVEFIRVNFDTEKEFLKANNVPFQSIILVFKPGEPTARIVGVTAADELSSKIKAAIG